MISWQWFLAVKCTSQLRNGAQLGKWWQDISLDKELWVVMGSNGWICADSNCMCVYFQLGRTPSKRHLVHWWHQYPALSCCCWRDSGFLPDDQNCKGSPFSQKVCAQQAFFSALSLFFQTQDETMYLMIIAHSTRKLKDKRHQFELKSELERIKVLIPFLSTKKS